MITASIFADFWNDQIVAEEKQGLFLVLVGFLLSFAFIRMSTRLMRSPKVTWWPGSVVSESGVHLHHLVFGIVTMMISGAIGFTVLGDSPFAEICAFAFGVGAGLTIDEFALWVYLEDVYWSEEGRVSIDATVLAAGAMGLILIGATPFTWETGSVDETIASLISAAVVLGFVGICFAKQRLLHGTVGFFVLPVAIYGAVRIGKPGSPWGRRRYRERNPEKLATAEDRFSPERRTERFKNAFRDVVGGKPSQGVAAATEEVRAAGREAVAEVRHGVERITHPEDRDEG
jgi:hypothetical protein